MTASIPAVDAHHHIWRLADLPWLQATNVLRIFGEYDAMRRDYSIEEYMQDAKAGGVTKSVYVQTNWHPEADGIEEAEWVRSVSDRYGWPHRIVAFANIGADPSKLKAVLGRLASINGVVGIRQQLHWHQNPQYRFAPVPDVMNAPEWQRNLAYLQDYDFTFELQLFEGQMSDGAALAAKLPGLTFILQHAGMLEDTSPSGWERWRSGMRKLAAQPNVVSKLSGLGTFVHKNDPALIAAIVKETVDIFGYDRCVFGSNFPIEKMWSSYKSLLDSHRAAVAYLPEAQQRAILHDNAVRYYKL